MKIGAGHFNFRAAAILIDQDRVLLHRNERDAFWALPGGRVKVLESTEQAVVREMKEELGVKVEIGRKLWFTENFFTYEGQSFHEIATYYLVKLADQESIPKGTEPFWGWEGEQKLIYQWFPVEYLDKMEVYPKFLREKMSVLPEIPEFLILHDELG